MMNTVFRASEHVAFGSARQSHRIGEELALCLGEPGDLNRLAEYHPADHPDRIEIGELPWV